MLASLLKSILSRHPREKRSIDGVFIRELAQMAGQKLQVVEDDNIDLDRYAAGVDPHARAAKWCQATVQDLAAHAADYGAAHDRLEDQESRDWFTQLVAYRLLGPRHVRLPSNTPAHWETREKVKAMCSTQVAPMFGPLGGYEVDFAGHRIALQAWWVNIAWSFFFRQYYFSRAAASIMPEDGDRVIDAGACFGDTALGFAATVGVRGRVLAFEIEPRNAAVARSNISRNPALAERIDLRECALADTDKPLYLHGAGPGAYVDSRASPHKLQVATIDTLLEAGELDRVDFIKMDIEGAEAKALAGAERTLRRFRPKLAISVYHTPVHLWCIANWLDSLRLGYRFYIDHYTIHYEETVLYAIAR